ncbi:MAG: response regulator [Gammaproteobacteria bacterium]|nr:response regulator [Gammaproteobacteria bacterium]
MSGALHNRAFVVQNQEHRSRDSYVSAFNHAVEHYSHADQNVDTAGPDISVQVVDDQFTGRKILEELVLTIDTRVRVSSFGDPVAALAQARMFPPHLIITDYKMPVMDGVEFTKRLRNIPSCADVPLMVVTVVDDREILYRALDAGATDFLTRPIDQFECRARCRNLITMHEQRLVIKNRARWLESQVDMATREILMREHETLLRLAKAGEYRDEETGNHVLRMARFSRLVAEQLALPDDTCTEIELAAPMHDIGKIGIPDGILRKPGNHTPAETNIMRKHTTIGHDILKNSPSRYLQLGSIIALSHHERFDGTGYPRGLAGEDIPLAARIVAVADAYDALTSQRPYKHAWSSEDAVAYIKQQSGRHFDPDCVAAFVARLATIAEVQHLLRD